MRVLVVGLFQVAAACYGQSAEEILAKVAETYRDAKSMRLELTEATRSTTSSGRPMGSGEDKMRSRKFHVSLALERPNKLRLSIRGVHYDEMLRWGALRREESWKVSEFQLFDYLAISDGQTVWSCVLDQPRQYTSRPVNPAHTGDLRSTMEFLTGRYRNLSSSATGVRIVQHARLKRSGRRINCVVIEAAGHKYWIDEQRYLVLLERAPGETLTWRVAELNPTFSKGTFVFSPPKNALQVSSLGERRPSLP